MNKLTILFVLLGMIGTADCSIAADPVFGRFDYPLPWEMVYSSYGFTVTGGTWELVGNPPQPEYKKLNYKIRVYDSTDNAIGQEVSGASNDWGGFYDYVPPFPYPGPTAFLRLYVENASSSFILCHTVTLNVQYAPQ